MTHVLAFVRFSDDYMVWTFVKYDEPCDDDDDNNYIVIRRRRSAYCSITHVISRVPFDDYAYK